MISLKIAFRNVFRNRRRSLMTLLAVAVGALATLVFGAFIGFTVLSLQTDTIRQNGHLAVFRTGYFNFGAGNPAAYGIDEYEEVQSLIKGDPVLKPLVAVATLTQTVFGIAGNYAANTTKTFIGVGVIPSDRGQMRKWNEFKLENFDAPPFPFTDSDVEGGVIGLGLGRILHLCNELDIPDCPATRPPPPPADESADTASVPDEDFSTLADRDRNAQKVAAAAGDRRPRIDLLSATTGGSPNVVSLYVARAQFQGIKDLDDNRAIMSLPLAQRLLYGRGKHKVTSIVLQLNRTADLEMARERLLSLIGDHKWDLEVRDYVELSALYAQALNFFTFLFSFLSAIIGMIVLFTIVNTMSMSVMERTNEIGTVRALGVQRWTLRWQFLMEGAVLGVMGATVGLLLAIVIVFIVNHAGLTWTPPAVSAKSPLRLYLYGNIALIVGTWIGLVALATLAAFAPANRAAKLPVVEALRHV
jgi:putative ABC transport system permease protein